MSMSNLKHLSNNKMAIIPDMVGSTNGRKMIKNEVTANYRYPKTILRRIYPKN